MNTTWHQSLEYSSSYHLLSLTVPSCSMICVDPLCIRASSALEAICISERTRTSYFLLGNYKSEKRPWLLETTSEKQCPPGRHQTHVYMTCWLIWITKLTYLPELGPEPQSGSHTAFYSGYAEELKHHLQYLSNW